MNDQQLLSDLLKWFGTMCNLDLQSDADRLLEEVEMPIERPELTEREKYAILTSGIQEEIERRKSHLPAFMPAQETALSQHGALGILLMWLKSAPGWTEADGMTKESMIAMLEKEMDSFEIGWQLQLFD